MDTNSTQKACEIALRSVVEAYENNRRPAQDTINEVKLALSLLTEGSPTVHELEPFIGRNWAICRNTKKMRERYDNCLSPAGLHKAKIKALAVRLGLSEGFVSVRI